MTRRAKADGGAAGARAPAELSFLAAAVTLGLAGGAPGPAHGAEPPNGERKDSAASADAGGLWQRGTLTGDWGGVRKRWDDQGVAFGFEYTGDALGNVRGGERRRAAYMGLLEMSLDLDLEKASIWKGVSLHAGGYQIHGRGLSAGALGNILTASSIEARSATRLNTLWIEQGLFDKKVSLRLGQLAADDEFAVSGTAAAFVNSTFGWPSILAENLTSGGPAYPLAAPGARIRWQPADTLTLQTAMFSGDPAGAGAEPDPQRRNFSGTTFSFTGGVFLIAEAQLASGEGGWLFGRPGTLKTGFWYHSGCFDDQRSDAGGRSLADPASSGAARRRCGNAGGYAVLDLALWRVPESKERGLNAFLRFGANPADRNLIGWYLDLGATFKGPFASRANDTAGVAFGIARIGERARALDRDAVLLAGRARPVRDYEAVLELTYQLQIAPWWTLQPDLQLILHPGGNAANPRSPTGAVIRDAIVVGMRTTMKF
jgi:porin